MTEHQSTDADDLRVRLAAADPALRSSINPIPDHLMEQIMATNPIPDGSPRASDQRSRPRWRVVAALGGLAVVVVAAVAIALTNRGGDGNDTAAPLALTGGDDLMASCMPFSVDILAEFPTALEGTVTSVDGPTVTLDVERWYRDGTGSGAETVVINAPEGLEALIDGVAFQPGQAYLVTADAEGNVAYCGYTGLATEELRAAFTQAFPA